MAVSREELIEFLGEAESRQDWETANAVLDKIEALGPVESDGFKPEPFTRNPEAPDAGINPIKGNLQALAQGASFGFGDEIQAGIAALTSGIGESEVTGEKSTYLDRYQQALAEKRAEIDQFRQQEGVAAYVPEVLGGMVTGLGGLAKAGTMKAGAAIGAAEGGLAGAGYADADELVSRETALSSGMGAGAGFVGGAVAPLIGRGVGKVASKVTDAVSDRFPNITGKASKIASETAEAGTAPDVAARFNIAPTGKATRDTLAIKAIDEFKVPEGIVNTVKELSPDDKQAALKMLRIIKIGKGNSAFRDANRPGDIVGKNLKDKIDFLGAERTKAGKQLDALVKGKLKGQPVAVDGALQKFADNLDGLGVTINQGPSGKITPDFDGALKLNTNDRKPIREAIRKINRVLESGRPTADVVHDLKRALDNEIPWDSSSKMTREGEDLLKSLRNDLNTTLQETFPGYGEVNGKLSDLIETMNGIAKTAGTKYNPDSPNADQFLGQELRKLATNYNSRVPLKDAIQQVEDISRKYGMGSTTDIAKQSTIVNNLEDLFGPSADRGFRAEIQKATRDGINETTKRAIRGERGGFIDKGIDTAHDLVSHSEEKQMEILEQLLTRQ